MPRKKKAKADEETRTLREKIEAYIFEGVTEFEQLSGIRVERIDIKPQSVWKIEKNKSFPKPKTIEKFCEVAKIPSHTSTRRR